MSDKTKRLIELVKMLLEDAEPYSSALELYALDGKEWALEVRELLAEMEAA